MIPGCHHSPVATSRHHIPIKIWYKARKTTRLLRPRFCPYSPRRMQSLKSQTLKPKESASHHFIRVASSFLSISTLLPRALALHQVHGSQRPFACTKICQFPSRLCTLVEIVQRTGKQSRLEDRFATHLFRPSGPAYALALVFLSE